MYDIFVDNENILALSTDRHHGSSKDEYASLNFAYHLEDKKENVDKNFKLLEQEFGISYDNIFIPKQTHSNNLVKVDKTTSKCLDNTDALYTKDKGTFVGVLTADCLPVLLYSPDQQLVGAIHAGWLGSTRLITLKTIQYLIEHEQVDPSLLQVYIGPSIFQVSYEVGQDVYDLVKQSNLDVEQCFIKKENGKYLFDNRLFNVIQLLECGINSDNITRINKCTYLNEDYFSYRRDHKTGRQLSMIGLKKDD